MNLPDKLDGAVVPRQTAGLDFICLSLRQQVSRLIPGIRCTTDFAIVSSDFLSNGVPFKGTPLLPVSG
ncbi:MAG: hypothetical protein WAV82_05765, partial [Methylobacter sp.]